jgi:hypothetical protein
MINLDLEKQINQQIQETIQRYVTSEDLQTRIREQVDAAVGNIIGSVASKVYAEVLSSSDIKNNITKIVQLETNQHVHAESLAIVRSEIARTPIRDIVEKLVRNEVNIKIDKVDFPNNSLHPSTIAWYPKSISGDYVSGGLITDFSSTGIDDKSTTAQLTILDNHVVVEGEFTAMNITAADTIQAKNLSLTGTLEIGTEILDHGPFSQMIQMHSQMVVDQALEPYHELIRDGKSLITGDSLAPSISQSNLRKVGNLQELNVIGDAKFSETLYVSAGGKVGINTEEPRGALTIRDEDAEVSFMKTNRRTMYIGSTRNSGLEIGTNNQSQIVIKEDLIELNNAVRVMGIKFSVSGAIPEHTGEPNEIVFVLSAAEGQPRFYRCTGGNRWNAL